MADKSVLLECPAAFIWDPAFIRNPAFIRESAFNTQLYSSNDSTNIWLKPKKQQPTWDIFTARCTLVQSAVLRLHVVRLSACITLVDQDYVIRMLVRWKSWKLIARTISLTPSLFLALRPSTYSQENTGKFWGD